MSRRLSDTDQHCGVELSTSGLPMARGMILFVDNCAFIVPDRGSRLIPRSRLPFAVSNSSGKCLLCRLWEAITFKDDNGPKGYSNLDDCSIMYLIRGDAV